MQGQDLLKRCPQPVKDILEKYFESLDGFYAYVYQLSAEQYLIFKKTQKFDTSHLDRLKYFLQDVGVEEMIADELISEINSDYDEHLVVDYAQKLLGPDWKAKLDAFDKMMNK